MGATFPLLLWMVSQSTTNIIFNFACTWQPRINDAFLLFVMNSWLGLDLPPV